MIALGIGACQFSLAPPPPPKRGYMGRGMERNMEARPDPRYSTSIYPFIYIYMSIYFYTYLCILKGHPAFRPASGFCPRIVEGELRYNMAALAALAKTAV